MDIKQQGNVWETGIYQGGMEICRIWGKFMVLLIFIAMVTVKY